MNRQAIIKKNGMGLKCLNAGCGDSYWKDWTNLDFQENPYVQYCDLRKGIPFPEGAFDIVYSSNSIEHFSYEVATHFLEELFRVLAPGGTLRLLTPDLERMAQEYLKNLQAWDKDKSDINRQRYEWILIEMFDQMTRDKSGGRMLEKIQEGDILPEYVSYRTGDAFRELLCPSQDTTPKKNTNVDVEVSLWQKIRNHLKKILFIKKNYPEIPFEALGEIHKWYYDRVSLEYLSDLIGFVDFEVVDYKQSRILGWEKYNLDISKSEDSARKPDSIVVEASKPEKVNSTEQTSR